MTEDQIKHMVQRFLGWKLPENFSPDAGISFKPTFNEHMPHPQKHEPSGTNLFDASQADAMVRYMVEGLSAARTPAEHAFALTTPSTPLSREKVARVCCSYHLNGGDPEQPALRWDSDACAMQVQEFPAWQDYLHEADALIAADREGKLRGDKNG